MASIMKSDRTLTLHSNGGQLESNEVAIIKGLDTIAWFNTKAVTNIFSLKNVAKKYKVTYDSNDAMFVVHQKDHGLPDMHFKMHKLGLHVFHPNPNKEFTLVETVAGNMEGFTKREVKRAYEAAKRHIRLVYPSMKDFNWIVMNGTIKYCSVTPRDVEVAQQTWGKHITPEVLRGKQVRTKPAPITGNKLKIPKDILNLCKTVHMWADFFSLTRHLFSSRSVKGWISLPFII